MTRVDFINCLMPLIGDAISMDFDSGLTLAVVYYTVNIYYTNGIQERSPDRRSVIGPVRSGPLVQNSVINT